MFVATQAFAATPINCRASVIYSYDDNGKMKTDAPRTINTAPAPDRENTIVAPRESGLQLAVTYSEDGYSLRDTSNYVNILADGTRVMTENDIPLDISNGSVTFSHTHTEGSTDGHIFKIVFSMSCVRVQQ